MKNFTIVFVHGYTASHLADWYPNISGKLDKLGIDYRIPDLPGGEYPKTKEWLDTLHKVISQTNKPLILVAHSLGTRAVLLYLEKYKPKVEKVFLIAAFRNAGTIKDAKPERNEKYPDFFTHKINLDAIKPFVGKFIVMHSKDDPSIPYEQGVKIAKDLDAELITFESRGHFFQPENAEIVLEELRKELKF